MEFKKKLLDLGVQVRCSVCGRIVETILDDPLAYMPIKKKSTTSKGRGTRPVPDDKKNIVFLPDGDIKNALCRSCYAAHLTEEERNFRR